MLAGLASLAGKGFTMESSDKISVYQSTFRPSEFTSHFNEKDITRYMCKLDRLDITDPYHAPGVLFTTIVTEADRETGQTADIIFNETQRLKKMKTRHKCHTNVTTAIPPLTAEEQSQFYTNLSKCHTQHGKAVKPAVLSIVQNHAQNYVPSVVNLDLPCPLTSLYDNANRDMSLEELQEKAERVFEEISITNQQVMTLAHT